MATQILKYDDSPERLKKLADERINRGDIVGGLGVLYRLYDKTEDYERLAEIADLYADMELYELSNRVWFKYLSVCPKESQGIAYEELGVNFFYMDNLYASGYYFHKKIATDGVLSREGLDKEILDYFSSEEKIKEHYRLAYPFERADYSHEIKEAKRMLVVNDFRSAKKYLSRVPEGCKQYTEALGELAMLSFLDGDTEQGIEYARKQLKTDGDNFNAYCNLSSLYHYKKDEDKSRYYYVKALEYPIKDVNDYYKAATCSLEQGEHQKAIGYMERVLKERSYENNIRYLYALALINCGKYERAESEFSYLCKLKPWDSVLKYYARLANDLQKKGDTQGVLPLEYIDDVPETEEIRRYGILESLPRNDESKLNRAIKKPEVFETLVWGARSNEKSVSKLCLIMLIGSSDKNAENALDELLLDPEYPASLKETALFIRLLSGYKKNINLVKSNCFTKFKPAKFRFENDPETQVFFIAYARAISMLVMSINGDFKKVNFATDRVFRRLKDKIDATVYGQDELATLIVSECGYPEFKNDGILIKIFECDSEKFKTLKKMMTENDND